MSNNKILVTGGCGYIGSVLVPKLLKQNYRVDIIDTCWFGNHLAGHHNLKVILSDVRKINNININEYSTIIHLAAIANDPSCLLDPRLTWETNCLATMQLADLAARNGVGRFLFVSSGSVYGVKDEDQVTEDLTLIPISEYNKSKMVAERAILSYKNNMDICIIRPATVCGVSPRMRFDVVVNMFTIQALENKKITIFGGDQVRPAIHIDDITDLFLFVLEENLTGVYNAGIENITLLNIAKIISQMISSDIVITESNDPRSYKLNSDKLLSSGFSFKKNVSFAINEIIEKYNNEGFKKTRDSINVEWMKDNIIN